ncbi:hypothetical protein Tsubulata_038270 [Turnera subulata]|uniref:K Homology domain-containing protein n=1 Tax=Turnera subulata TaxID=218843 RepID=A0A9Q0J6R7_9ROSI|nr:hypothetical protein Tsubulata_038270 [Turnera subulata]
MPDEGTSGGEAKEVNDGERGSSPSTVRKVIEVSACLIRFIKQRGSTLRKIEEEMGVKIVFPSSNLEEFVTIEGSLNDSVNRASEKFQALMDKAIASPNLDYSHFVSLPLAIHPELVDKLVKFQNSILGNSNASLNENSGSGYDENAPENGNEDSEASMSPTPSDLGIDHSIFVKSTAFHLTILRLKLWSKERVSAASEVLKSIRPKVIDALENQPVSISLKGLALMRGSLSEARVVYIPVEEVGKVITNAFVDAGLVMEEDVGKELKLGQSAQLLHFRELRRKNDSFDAWRIFEQFGSEEWGEYLIREAHLSQRFVYDENGYYHCCASIPFPKSLPV